MSLINNKLCKFEINYAKFYSIISGNTIQGFVDVKQRFNPPICNMYPYVQL